MILWPTLRIEGETLSVSFKVLSAADLQGVGGTDE